MTIPPLSLGLSKGVERVKALDSEFFSLGQAHGLLQKAGAHTPVHALSGRLQAGPNGRTGKAEDLFGQKMAETAYRLSVDDQDYAFAKVTKARLIKTASNAARRLFTKLMKDMADGSLRWHGTNRGSVEQMLKTQKFNPSYSGGNAGDMTLTRHLPSGGFNRGGLLGLDGASKDYRSSLPFSGYFASKRVGPLVNDPFTASRYFPDNVFKSRLSDGPVRPIPLVPRSGVLRWAGATTDPALNAALKQHGARLIPLDLVKHLSDYKAVPSSLMSDRALKLLKLDNTFVNHGRQLIDRKAGLRHLSAFNNPLKPSAAPSAAPTGAPASISLWDDTKNTFFSALSGLRDILKRGVFK